VKQLAVLAIAAACGVRAPPPVDVLALTRELGSEGARRALVARVLADPRDVQARLALATLADHLGRPGEALDQLDAVVALGGPLGTRWHDADRARMSRLLLARGRVRLARGAATALDDLRRAGELGAEVPADELARAHVAHALARLRHVDLHEREAGRHELADRDLTRDRAVVDPEVVGARDRADTDARGAYGAWLWQHGARRAAYDELATWHEDAATHDPAIAEAYLRALAWWTPWDGPPLPDDAIAEGGTARCRFARCPPLAALGTADEAALALAPPGVEGRDPAAALAWLAIEVGAARRGEVALGPALRARVDAAIGEDPRASPVLRWAFAYVAGAASAVVSAAGTPLEARTAAALEAALAGSDAAGSLPDDADPRELAAARYAAARVPGAVDERILARIAYAYRNDAAVADRLGRDAIARSVDGASARAAVASLFDALADPGRARVLWQAAADASGEPAFFEGLAEAAARGNDPDAALIDATTAAAASGDPGVVWARVSRVLADAGRHAHALTAARSAIDLAGPDALAAALEAAIAASRALGRTAQVASLSARRAALWPPVGGDAAGDPTDPIAAVAALDSRGRADIDRLWLASRWAPRDVATRAAFVRLAGAADVRRRACEAELVALAGDADPLRGLAAALALGASR
jgi:hypothetical protein